MDMYTPEQVKTLTEHMDKQAKLIESLNQSVDFLTRKLSDNKAALTLARQCLRGLAEKYEFNTNVDVERPVKECLKSIDAMGV